MSQPGGTLLTMAREIPEENRFSPASDVFAWAVSMCMITVQALRGIHLSSRRDIKDLALLVINKHSPALGCLLMECLAEDYRERPCAEEVRDRLLHIAGSWPVVGEWKMDCPAVVLLEHHFVWYF